MSYHSLAINKEPKIAKIVHVNTASTSPRLYLKTDLAFTFSSNL
jgi:hypothetical protein